MDAPQPLADPDQPTIVGEPVAASSLPPASGKPVGPGKRPMPKIGEARKDGRPRCKKISGAERAELMAFMRTLITRCVGASRVVRVARKQFPNLAIGRDSFIYYYRRTRALILKERKTDPEIEKAVSAEFYASVLVDKDATLREKLLARERLDRLYGCESPFRHEVKHQGAPAQTIASVQALVLNMDEDTHGLLSELAERLGSAVDQSGGAGADGRRGTLAVGAAPGGAEPDGAAAGGGRLAVQRAGRDDAAAARQE